MAAVSLTLASCMDGDDSLFNDTWKEPEASISPYGNNDITEDNIITIADLKSRSSYAKAISSNKYEQIKEDIKIKARVTGNDLAGNIYKQVIVQDATGGIIIGVNKAGLCGYLAEGQEIIVDLKDLYIGGYGGTAQIGSPYNGGIGRMAESIWMKHFKLVGSIDANQIKPIEFTPNSTSDNNLVGKLVVLKNVTFKSADGVKTLINGKRESSTSNYYHQEIDGFSSNVVIRTSSYADFAAVVMPFDKATNTKKVCSIIGIASQYNGTWQIMIRKTSDIVLDGDVETADDTSDGGTYSGKGTLESPFTVDDILKYTQSLAADKKSDKDLYIKGKVASIAVDKNGTPQNFDSGYGNATFYISDDGSETNTFQVYRALYLGNKEYSSGDLLKPGDDVIICGKVTNYKGNTPETVQKEAYVYSLNGKTE